ncbi:hypothetical protein [Polaromonas sp. CG_23.6]|uniref:hypothetical protein n=1 Tax=Polaromonas sp. CG_23.6 TaxID=2760709 RepID=UPI002475C560|nr:hypothetical protein [Polaromonas sp. CG_23.6]MDH6185323.1 hypothetical protein [Polaromonas sp. CG_23.6]
MNLIIENPLEKLPEIYSKISEVVALAKIMFPSDQSINIPRVLAEYVSQLNNNIEIFSNFGIVDGIEDFEKALKVANAIGIYATALGQQGAVLLPTSQLSTSFSKILAAGQALTNYIGSLQVSVAGIIDAGNGPMLPNIALQKNWKMLESDLLDRSNNFHSKLDVAESDLARYESRVEAFSESINTNLRKLEDEKAEISQQINFAINAAQESVLQQGLNLESQYEETIANLKLKEFEVVKLLGNLAVSVIAGGYAKSATNEQKSANWFRIFSIVLMMMVVVLLSVTLFESSNNEMNWKEISLRLIISLFLSVPIAYLARESSRHRSHHYSHLQTSLDMAALGPFIESLSPELREKVKAAMVEKIFFQNAKDEKIEDNYGINIQSLLMKFIDTFKVQNLNNK